MNKLTLYIIDYLGKDSYFLECSILLFCFDFDTSDEEETTVSTNLVSVYHICIFINI